MCEKRRILFLCTGNACRSQIAEGLLRLLAPDRYASLSAGVRPAGFVHPLTRQVLEEVGGDLSGHFSKSVDVFFLPAAVPPDLVVTLCDYADREWRRLRRKTPRIHWRSPDPIFVQGNMEERLVAFRQVRDRICIQLEDALDQGFFDATIEAEQGQGKTRSRMERVLSRLMSALQVGGRTR